MLKTFSGRGYCTQPTCFPVLGAPPILVFLCKTHCRHMLCYRHWLSHQTTEIEHEQDMDNSSSTVTLDSDIEEQENVPDLLKECTNQEEHQLPKTNVYYSTSSPENIDYFEDDENKDIVTSFINAKEIEWWNEITPWKNGENFNMETINKGSSDDEYIYNDPNNKTDDSDYDIKGKRRVLKKKLSPSTVCRSYAGECPLTFDGAFGLFQEYHQHQLCTTSKHSNKKICLYQHFNSKHGFKRQISIRLVKAMIHQEDPSKSRLFSLITDTPSTLFDPFHKVKCPLATNNHITNTPCLTQEITRKSVRRHLSGVHRLDQETINKLMKQMNK